MSEFNLITEPWIPCIDIQGKQVPYGIRDTLLKAHELREICDDSPLVTVAIHRLLLAILYRAFEGPNGFNEWKTLYSHKTFNEQIINNYLEQWIDRFYLYDRYKPFYQMPRFKTKKPISVNRLATECAGGNNPTLFDHSGDDDEVNWQPATAARMLISCQAFALGFGKSGNATINEIEETLPYSADAIALRGMNIWLQGNNLLDTLMINLTPIEENLLPPWELENTNEYRDRLQGKNRKAVSARGVVDRFTWQSRLVQLIPDDSTISKMYFTQGRSADKSAGDPMKVYRTSKKEGISALPLSSNKAAWRDAHSILMIPTVGSSERRPECLNLVVRASSSDIIDAAVPFIAQIVGLASAPKKAGKFLLWRHERMPVPASLLDDVNLIERLGGLIQNSENGANELNSRTRRIAMLYLAPNAESTDGRNPDDKDVTKLSETIASRPAYWARLEKHFYTLLENLPYDWDKANGEWKPNDQQLATKKWREHIKREAEQALNESIRSLGNTARAIQAVARVRTDFNDYDLEPWQQKKPK
ncbi:MAG: type I-E CRISPR-associated protein Cse1/CasA [Candidatus Hatepunaea meridiana]|nr:type I-E CRISPR-associated protein Cse1/CasA [Candidatus Hatepunaea meridiana]